MPLYVPLDVDYASDDKLIEAGPMAELLYVRGLAFCKRTMSDGVIRRSQLAAVGLGIPAAAKHAQRLVDVGAWAATPHGWRVVAWLKRNKSAAQIRHDGEAKKAASVLANHKRWHIGEGKDASPTCPLCHPKPDANPDANPETLSESTKQSQSQREGKTEAESESEGRDQFQSPTTSTVGTRRSAVEDEDGTLASISALVRRGAR